MPSPIGHVLAGAAVALAVDRRAAGGIRRFLSRPLTLAAIALAALPDADLLVAGFHRTATHSVGATLLVTIVAIVVTGWVTPASERGRRLPKVALVCALAHASHVLTDWLGADWFHPPGIQALWPFDDRWYISGWDVFARVERRNPFSPATMISNLRAAAREVAILGSIVAGLWWISTRRPADPGGAS